MASDLIGRMACPECDFPHAHIKIKNDKEGAHPYRHCPECGAQYFTRNQLQASNLRKRMRPEGDSGTLIVPVGVKAEPLPARPIVDMVKSKQKTPSPSPLPAPSPAPAPAAQKFTTVFGVKVPV